MIMASPINLREWLAGMALQGILAGDNLPSTDTVAELAQKVAACAFLYADAMLEQSKKEA
jgi:hypothetical protein